MKIKKRYLTAIIIAAALLSIGVMGFIKDKNKIDYQTKSIEKCTITQYVEASGTINPVNTFSVGSTVSGLINAIYVDYNSEVTKGQLLAEIDPRTFQASVQQSVPFWMNHIAG